VFFPHTLMFVDRVDYLRPEIPTDLITAIDALIQPFNCEIGCSDPVLLDQVPRCFVNLGGHRRSLSDFSVVD
jgi:hypothetical protein